MKPLHLITLIIASMLFTACETEMDVTLYASDLLEMEEDIDLDARLYFEIPSADWLDEDDNRPKLARFLSQHFGQLGEFSTKSVELTTFCVVPFKTTLATEAKDSDMFALSRASTPSGVDVHCEINAQRFKNFKSGVSDEFMSSIKLEDMKFRVIVDNDTKGPIEVTGYSVFLGKEPAAFERSVTLERRDELTVRVSAIHLAAIDSGGKSRILKLSKK